MCCSPVWELFFILGLFDVWKLFIIRFESHYSIWIWFKVKIHNLHTPIWRRPQSTLISLIYLVLFAVCRYHSCMHCTLWIKTFWQMTIEHQCNFTSAKSVNQSLRPTATNKICYLQECEFNLLQTLHETGALVKNMSV